MLENQRVERFIESYNRIKDFFQKELNAEHFESLPGLMDEYLKKKPYWKNRRELAVLADIRNLIDHNKTAPNRYVCIPSEESLQRILAIEQGLLSPQRVIPKFQRQVVSFQINDSLSKVLKCIELEGFSQFPIYSSENFAGLLTENGITRYLSYYVGKEDTLIDLKDETISNVLQLEEEKPELNFHFASRRETIDEMVFQFSCRPLLEAILITQNGKEDEKLLGIMTRWDMVAYQR